MMCKKIEGLTPEEKVASLFDTLIDEGIDEDAHLASDVSSLDIRNCDHEEMLEKLYPIIVSYLDYLVKDLERNGL